METVDDQMDRVVEATVSAEADGIQPGGFLLELSPDWIVRRASENIHHLLRESHVTLIDEPLGRFVHGQALHDLRNLFARLSGTTGIGRAYGVRLTDDPDRVDVAFQLCGGRVLLEAVSASSRFGEHFGSVGGLIAGLSEAGKQALIDGGARRMRALTGYDRVILSCGELSAESSRGLFGTSEALAADLPRIVMDVDAPAIPIFPRLANDRTIEHALLAACDKTTCEALGRCGVRAILRLPFSANGVSGEFRCESRTPRPASLELHAAAELFAQMFALRLELAHRADG